MPFLIGLIGLVIAAYFWAQRARNAALVANELADMAGDVLSAARRFGFRRKTSIHPVDAVEDVRLAIAGAGIAFLEIGALPSKEQHRALMQSLARTFAMPEAEAEEALILGRWLSHESGGGAQAFTRLLKRVHRLKGAEGFDPLMAVLRDAGLAAGSLSGLQKDALTEVQG
ncbi:MAG: hypothetical protein ACK4RN_09210 [Pseudorhodobacter sp.]